MRKTMGYVKVIATAVAMITIVCAAWRIALQEIDEQVAVAGDLLEDLKLQDFRSCMELRLPQDKDEDEGIEADCKEQSGLK